MIRRRIAWMLATLIILILVVSQLGWASDDRVFYGLIALVVLSQIAWLAYVLRRQRQESLIDLLEQRFSDD